MLINQGDPHDYLVGTPVLAGGLQAPTGRLVSLSDSPARPPPITPLDPGWLAAIASKVAPARGTGARQRSSNSSLAGRDFPRQIFPTSSALPINRLLPSWPACGAIRLAHASSSCNHWKSEANASTRLSASTKPSGASLASDSCSRVRGHTSKSRWKVSRPRLVLGTSRHFASRRPAGKQRLCWSYVRSVCGEFPTGPSHLPLHVRKNPGGCKCSQPRDSCPCSISCRSCVTRAMAVTYSELRGLDVPH